MRNIKLWNAICAFDIDGKGPITFTKKLTLNHSEWSFEFAVRLVQEYKKFMYLSSFMEVTPSLGVDETWHLHLQYTKSYWIDLCKNIIGKDIHHNPGNGDKVDELRYRELYAATLRVYREEFGGPPPTDIWGIQKPYAPNGPEIFNVTGRGVLFGASPVLLMSSGAAWTVLLSIGFFIFALVLIVNYIVNKRNNRYVTTRRNFDDKFVSAYKSSLESGATKISSNKKSDYWLDTSSYSSHPSCSSSSSDSGHSDSGSGHSGGDSGGGGSSGSSCSSSSGSSCSSSSGSSCSSSSCGSSCGGD